MLVDGVWRYGELRGWRQDTSDWIGTVQWSAGPAENYLGIFPADVIRPVTSPSPATSTRCRVASRHLCSVQLRRYGGKAIRLGRPQAHRTRIR